MIKREKRNIKNQRGFSLAEILLTVGILAILAAISFPALFQFNRQLNQTKLDNSARAIFLSAQNKLTGMGNNGMELPVGTTMGATAPVDFAETGLPWSNTGADTDAYVYVAKTDATFMADTPVSDTHEAGEYIIEYHRFTGAVYGVYYWETQRMDYGGVSSFDYTTNYNYYTGSGALLPLRGDGSKENRQKVKVGYYGANGVEELEKVETFDYTLEVKNEETLSLNITPDDMSIGMDTSYIVTISSVTDSSNATKYTYHVGYKNGSAVALDEGGSNQSIPSNITSSTDYSIRIILDSLESGNHFANRFPGIVAGDDINIEVHAIYSGTKGLYTEAGPKQAITNSLFDSVRKTATAMAPDGDIVQIKNGRHLQNLSCDTSNFTYTANGEQSPFAVRKAELQTDIEWDSALNTINSKWSDTGILSSFFPIGNDKTSLNHFDGMGYKISDLIINKYHTANISGRNVSGAGLFGVLSDGVTLENFTLENSYVHSNETVSAAAVVGYLTAEGTEESSIKKVSCIDCTVSSDGNAGMLAGQIMSGKVMIADCSVYLDDAKSSTNHLLEESVNRNYYVKSSGASAGGLVGLQEKHSNTAQLTIQDSFSAVNIHSKWNAGGLVGLSTQYLTIKNCYSSGNVTSTDMNSGSAGGILGKYETQRLEVNNCFTTSDVTANAYSGGAFGHFASGHVSLKNNVYSYGKVLWRDGKPCTAQDNEQQGNSHSGGFIGRSQASSMTISEECYYLSMTGYNNSNASGDGYGAKYNNIAPALYAKVAAGAAFMPPADGSNGITYAYQSELKGKEFPFKMINSSHAAALDYHGNWPMPVAVVSGDAFGICYYEIYRDTTAGNTADTTAGLYIKGVDKATYVGGDLNDPSTVGLWRSDSLIYDTNSKYYVEKYGYCFAVPKGYKLHGYEKEENAPDSDIYDFYKIKEPHYDWQTYNTTELPVVGERVCFNVEMGAAIRFGKGENDLLSENGSPKYASDYPCYYIRAYDQLKNIEVGYKYMNNNNYLFEQNMNIVKTDLKASSAINTLGLQTTIDGKGRHMVVTDGMAKPFVPERSYSITLDMKVPENNYGNIGLIGACQGTLRNLIVKETITMEGTSTGITGGIAGKQESGVIDNCQIELKITGANQSRASINGATVGGVVGIVTTGDIKNCTAQVDIDLNAIGGTVNTGGVLGKMDNPNVLFESNTASGKIDIDGSKSGEIYAGGVIGYANDGKISKAEANMDIKIQQASEGKVCVGGLTGFLGSIPLEGSHSAGEISITECNNATLQVGGLIGFTAGTVSDCKSATKIAVDGKLKGDSYIGGFMGYTNGGTYTNNTASGDVACDKKIVVSSKESKLNIGGFAGHASAAGLLTENTATGNVACDSEIELSGALDIGGFVGSTVGTLRGNSTTGEVCTNAEIELNGDSNAYIGGFAGYGKEQKPIVANAATGKLGENATVHGIGGKAYVGGFAGYLSSNVESCYFAAEMGEWADCIVGQFIASTDTSSRFNSCYGWTSRENTPFYGEANATYQSQFVVCYAYGTPETSDAFAEYIPVWSRTEVNKLGSISMTGWSWAWGGGSAWPYFKKQ